MYRIVEYYAENFKRLRLVEFTPKGRVTIFTGRNDQGKTSALDAITYALGGKKYSPDVPLRKGAKGLKVKLDLGELIVTRTANALTVEPAPGVRAWDTPQAMLDSIFDELSFDPMTFTKLKPKEQAEMLRRAVDLEVDIDELSAKNKQDYEDRREINREVERLQANVSSYAVTGTEKPLRPDLEAINAKLAEANERNRNLAQAIEDHAKLKTAVADAEQAIKTNENDYLAQSQLIQPNYDASALAETQEYIAELNDGILEQVESNFTDEAAFAEVAATVHAIRLRLSRMRAEFHLARTEANNKATAAQKAIEAIEAIRPTLRASLAEAQTALENAVMPELIDVRSILDEIEAANKQNRLVDVWEAREQVREQLKAKEAEARRLTRNMEERDEQKRQAIAKAKLPVDGLTFDEDGVYIDGVPISQLGEARQIRIGIQIVLARKPKLRLIRIPHGESLDDETLADLSKMAEEKDFYIWMAKVDTSGKVGIYLEEGEVKAINE